MTSKTERHPLLNARALSIGYPNKQAHENLIAENLNLDLNVGRFVCLLGPNGTGKSTLIRTLSGMQAPLGGDIHVHGINLSEYPLREKARNIGVVLTESSPAGMMTVFSLVALGRHPYSGWFGKLNQGDMERIRWALDAVDVSAMSNRQVSELSDGERQKVFIARALAQEAKLLFLDEPTAFLDITRRVELMGLLRRLSRSENLSLLLSTHDLDLALRFADELWILSSSGTLIKGPPEELVLNGSLAKVFSSENLNFEPMSGSFLPVEGTCQTVSLSGSGAAREWTRRALARLGYAVDNFERPGQATSPIKIDVQANEIGEVQWIVNADGYRESFNRLSTLIEWIEAK